MSALVCVAVVVHGCALDAAMMMIATRRNNTVTESDTRVWGLALAGAHKCALEIKSSQIWTVHTTQWIHTAMSAYAYTVVGKCVSAIFISYTSCAPHANTVHIHTHTASSHHKAESTRLLLLLLLLWLRLCCALRSSIVDFFCKRKYACMDEWVLVSHSTTRTRSKNARTRGFCFVVHQIKACSTVVVSLRALTSVFDQEISH